MHEHNNSFNRTLTKLVTILTKCFFFPYLNPTSYIKTNQIVESDDYAKNVSWKILGAKK